MIALRDVNLTVGKGEFLAIVGPSGCQATSRAGTSILDVSVPSRPELLEQWPAPANTHSHKVQVAGGLLLTNHERFPYRPKTPLGRSGRLRPGRTGHADARVQNPEIPVIMHGCPLRGE